MWQFERAVTGLADGCLELGIPVTGGNVSFYNSTGDVAIHPTPVVGVLGVLDDVARRTPSGWREPGHAVYLLGTTSEELAGSEWAWVEHAHLGGLPPAVDLGAERTLGEVLVGAAHEGLVSAAHDVSDGGLAQTLVEACLRYGVGARVRLDEVCARDGVTPFVALFAESTARAVVAVPADQEARFADLCAARGYPLARIGVVDGAAGPDGGQGLTVEGLFTLSLDELAAAHTGTLPAVFGA
jgi:phosphoribosylformylglycinamidine synthase